MNFALRSPAEQDALTAAYGRWLQLPDRPGADPDPGRARRPVRRGRRAARGTPRRLPHPALEHAALEPRRVPRRPGRRAGRADPAGAAGHPRARPRRPRPGRGSRGRRGPRSAPPRPPGCWPPRTCRSRSLDGGQVTALLAAAPTPARPHRAAAAGPARPARHQPGQARMTRPAPPPPRPPRRRAGARTCPARPPSRSPPGTCGSATTAPPPWPSPATPPRSPPGGWSRCCPTPAGSTSPCTSSRSRPPWPRTGCAGSAPGWNPAAAPAPDRGQLDDPDTEAAAEDARELAYRLARGEGKLFRARPVPDRPRRQPKTTWPRRSPAVRALAELAAAGHRPGHLPRPCKAGSPPCPPGPTR